MRTLIQPALLTDWMAYRDFTGAQLGRVCGVSRQFIHQLRTGARTSCSDEVAIAIETALMVPPGAVFREARATARKVASTAA